MTEEQLPLSVLSNMAVIKAEVHVWLRVCVSLSLCTSTLETPPKQWGVGRNQTSLGTQAVSPKAAEQAVEYDRTELNHRQHVIDSLPI